MSKMKGFLKNRRYALAAFFLPVLITVLAFAVTGIYPFGPNQITVIDMYHQYVPFLSELQYKLHHGGSLFYSWHGAAGYNFWNMMAYYCASPLNLLLILFPEKLIVEGVTVILLIKIGLAGSFMYLFLSCVYGREAVLGFRRRSAAEWTAVGFGSFYALSAYMLAYYWCIMWLDAVALLPLTMLGLVRLVNEGRGALYAVCLGLTCFCNYYIAIMVCIFTVLYYFVLYFERPREGGFVQFLMTSMKTALYSIIGAATAAAMLIPTYISMQNTYYIGDDMPEDWNFYSDPLDVFNQLLPNAHLSYREGLPNICCGLIVCMMLICYFLLRSIPLRRKICRGLLLALLFMSLNVNKLDFLWHGCHFPNQLPFRFSFVICFVLIAMAYQAIGRLPQIRLNTIWAVFAGGLGYYLLASKVLKDAVDDPDLFFYVGAGLLMLYTFLLVLYRKGMLGARSFPLLLILVIAAELMCCTTAGFQKVGNVDRAEYLDGSEKIAALVKETEGDTARTELYEWSIMNTPALFHYRGISQFSSSLNAQATGLMESIGVEGEPGKNRYNYVISDPVTNAILNLKYIISTADPMEDHNFTVKDTIEGYSLYENRWPLSVGYVLPESIRTWDLISANPFEVLDDYVRASTGNLVRGVFHELEEPKADAIDINIEEEGGGMLLTEAVDGETGMVRLEYTATETANHYVYIEADRADSIQVIRDDGEIKDLREDCGAVVNIGEIPEGDSFYIEVNYEPDGEGSIRSHVCTMDEKAWQKAYDLISRDMMEVTDHGDTFIEGTVNASADGIFTTSVLNEKGWTLKVDGVKREITEPVGGDLIAIPMSMGSHTISLRFMPPGFIAGCVLMVLGIAALILLCQLRQRRIRRRMQSEIPSSGI